MNSAHTHSAWTLRGIRMLGGLALLAALALAGCGSGGTSSSTSASVSTKQSACSTCGTAMVSLTDAPGDFVSYMVNVDSLSLTNSDGTVVQTVPATTQVDFAQLVNLSEIISAHQLPPGTYTSAKLTLDYSNADIVVSTSNGNVTVPAADLINGSTNKPISGPITITLSLKNNPLIITEGSVSNLAIDFNLAASNTVDLSANPITVTVDPVLSASLTPATSKTIHVRGPLVSVDTSNSDYVVNVRPFEDPTDDFGQLTVNTTSTTSYLINGTAYTGSAGLTALAALPANTLTTAYGSWDRTNKTFTATVVHAGSSVIGVSGNSVVGTVTARNGNTITLGNTLMYLPLSSDSQPDDGMRFQSAVTVTVGPNTAVSELGQSGNFTSADISVGQRVRFTGTLSSSSSSSSTSTSTSTSSTQSLDATSGGALLLPTDGTGLVTASASGSLTVNLQSLGHDPVSALNFAGTGATSAQDASAASYQVQTPTSFSTNSLGTGVPVQFTGFVAPFGAAPPDFVASTVVSSAQTNAGFYASWNAPGTTTAFSSLSASQLVVGQVALQSASSHVIRLDDFNQIDASTLSGGVTLVPASSSSTSTSSSDSTDTEQVFVIAHQSSDTVDSFSTFSAFTTALNSALSNASVLKIAAQGSYGANNTITANRVYVVLND